MPLSSIPIHDIDIVSDFWSPLQERAETITLPAIFEAQKSWNHWTCLTWKEGHVPQPHQFWDSDIYKAVEAACYILIKSPNEELRAIVEDAVSMIRGAQHSDGYINSYYTVRGIEKRWTNLRDDHELYCMGHLLEAVVAYETLTGNGRLLEVAMKVCKHLDETFGLEEGKKRGYPGHEEIEIGLLRLHELTEDPQPLKLAKYFIFERGRKDEKGEIYFDKEAFARGGDPYDPFGTEFKHWYHEPREYGYHQADGPIVDATEVKGHSVRAMYYYTAATHLAQLSGDKALKTAIDRLWRDLVDSKLYVTGAMGSDGQCEGFAAKYQLPDLESEGCYGETCASFALINWCTSLLRYELKSEYADTAEVALYNAFLGAMSAEGDAFYYQNVLRTRHGEPKERSKWFGVACCPPNVAKLLGNLGSALYSYDASQDLLAIHQYIGAKVRIPETDNVIQVASSLPWAGKSTIRASESCNLALRIPNWAKDDWSCSESGKMRDGYLHVEIKANTEVTLNFTVAPRKLYAHPATGKDEICIMRGPLVYCLEDVDNAGVDIDTIKLVDEAIAEGESVRFPEVGEVKTVQARAKVQKKPRSDLYRRDPWQYEDQARTVTAIPYYLRSNRGGNGAMRVWVPR